jgi:hypothetical protein
VCAAIKSAARPFYSSFVCGSCRTDTLRNRGILSADSSMAASPQPSLSSSGGGPALSLHSTTLKPFSQMETLA